MVHLVVHHFGDCAHHSARFVILAQVAQLCIIVMMVVVFPIFCIIETDIITETISDGNQPLLI